MINYRTEDFVERVKEITDGKGCDVVYDSVGQDTYPGLAGLPETARAVGQLRTVFRTDHGFQSGLACAKGFSVRDPADLCSPISQPAQRLKKRRPSSFDVVQKGIVKIEVNQEYRLADAVQAHQDLEGQKTTGTTVLIP